ncbi:MAG: hypothetical protein WCI74_05860, partial [Actinomycetes bacterium]
MSTLSVRCMTNGPLPRVAAILAQYREVADEIICIANARFTDAELAVLRPYADRVVRAQMRPGFSIGHYRAWERKLSSDCDWVLVIDHDEVPSRDLLDNLPGIMAVPHVAAYQITKRWSFPDAGHWLDEDPWAPNWSSALIRNDPNMWHFDSALHVGTIPPHPLRQVDLPTYHLACLVESAAARVAKVKSYRDHTGADPAAELDGTELMYLPEQAAALAPATTPARDLEIINRVL